MKTLAWLLRIFLCPINIIPLLLIIRIPHLKNEWKVTPFTLTGYFLVLAALSSFALLYMDNVWWIVGAYIMTAILIESLWKCVLLILGHQAIIYPRYKPKYLPDDKSRRLLTSTALYMGVVAYGYSVYYFGYINLMTYKMIMDSSFKGVADTSAIELLWQFVYYSAVTITTLGYSDIRPISFFTQAVTILEVIFGIFFIVFLFGTFLSYHVNRLAEMKKK